MIHSFHWLWKHQENKGIRSKLWVIVKVFRRDSQLEQFITKTSEYKRKITSINNSMILQQGWRRRSEATIWILLRSLMVVWEQRGRRRKFSSGPHGSTPPNLRAKTSFDSPPTCLPPSTPLQEHDIRVPFISPRACKSPTTPHLNLQIPLSQSPGVLWQRTVQTCYVQLRGSNL